MRLVGDNGDVVELTVAGYQFPKIHDERWDSNWLEIRTVATVGGQSWATHEPCLLTFEVEMLADWLEALGDGRRVESELDFMEPNLAFECEGVDKGVVRLCAWFECEARPAWNTNDTGGARDLAARVGGSGEHLIAAAGDLRVQLARYPTRVPLQRD